MYFLLWQLGKGEGREKRRKREEKVEGERDRRVCMCVRESVQAPCSLGSKPEGGVRASILNL